MSEELLKELSLLQDELNRLQPAIKQIEVTSQSAKLIEKKIPKVTKRLDSIKQEALSIAEEIKNTVKTFEEISSDPKSKLDEIKNKLDKFLVKYEGKAETQKQQWDTKFRDELGRFETAIGEAESFLKETDALYNQKVSSLIEDVEDKTQEIFEIYNVLDEIKAAQKEYSGFMEEAETILSEKLESVNNKMAQGLDASIEKRISGLAENSKSILDETSSNATSILNNAQAELEKKESGLDDLNSLYESKANELIKSIKSKSGQITTIYDELENIRETNKKYKSLLEATEGNSEIVFENMKKEFDRIKDAAKSLTTISHLEALDKKVEKLEKHAHRHNFGGKPV